MNYLTQYPWLSILPPVVSILLALLTRNVIISLSLGIFTGGILVTNSIFSLEVFKYLWESFLKGFFDGGLPDWGHISLLLFLWMLGMLIHLMQKSGYLDSFSDFLSQKLKNRQAGQFFTLILGFVLFIDDYFKILAISNISRPICDRLGISRVKLAYFLDVTAAPLCSLTPISSWGATIIALLAGIIASQGILGYNAFSLFITVSIYNWYAILALVFVFLSVALKFDFKKMKKFELLAQSHITEHTILTTSKIEALKFILPILVLTVVTFFFLLGTGFKAIQGETITFLKLIKNGKTEISLLLGGVFASGVCFLLRKKSLHLLKAAHQGLKTMFPSIVILVFAWALATVIGDVKTGNYLASFVQNNEFLSPHYVPFFMFLIAGSISFATGTSWATFGILLPISAEIALNSDPSLLVPLMSACIGGSIFGDHASPISDTSILSSTGAQCDHMDHVTTQLPYALLPGGITLIAYLMFGITHNLQWSSLFALALIVISTYGFRWYQRRVEGGV